MIRLRYCVIAMALSLAFPLNAYAAVCSETDNNINPDDILQNSFDQAILFGTNPANSVTQELGQSFTAPCDGHLDLFRTAYQAPDALSAGVTISGNAILFDGAGTTGTTLATVPFSFTLEATTDLRIFEVVFDGVAVTEGTVYTIFFDITSGSQTARIFASDSDAYAGGTFFSSNTGSAAGAGAPSPWDLGFRARFKPTPVASEEAAQSRTVSILPTRPNPAAGRTLIPFTLRQPAEVRLAVYDALGREVALVADRSYGAGEHAEALDMSDFAPGTYVVRLAAGPDVVLRTISVAR